jgi:uncharacterized protein YuzE
MAKFGIPNPIPWNRRDTRRTQTTTSNPSGGRIMHLTYDRNVGGMINLDFDASGRLVGVEVLDASRLLPPEALATQT